MGTKAAVAFANIFMAEIETQILQQSKHKPLEWIRHIHFVVLMLKFEPHSSYQSVPHNKTN